MNEHTFRLIVVCCLVTITLMIAFAGGKVVEYIRDKEKQEHEKSKAN